MCRRRAWCGSHCFRYVRKRYLTVLMLRPIIELSPPGVQIPKNLASACGVIVVLDIGV